MTTENPALTTSREATPANVGNVALGLAELYGGKVVCEHAEDGYVRVGFAQDRGYQSYAVEVTVEVGTRFGGDRKIHVTHSWSSNGGRSITQMQLGLASAAQFITDIKQWGFKGLEVAISA